ncbi:MAG: reverse transcriptase family protein [Ignavibacteriaceae bacterium]|jgi:hypothetical protein|nr:reverse transcriptase family protein [Ignavibacteriaceae bacterium]
MFTKVNICAANRVTIQERVIKQKMEFSRNTFKEFAEKDKHSEEFIKNTLEYALVLTDRNLPVIFSTKHLALIFGYEYKELQRIIAMRNSLYHFYQISKKRGGKRQIAVPHKSLYFIQQWIRENILDKLLFDDCVNAYVKQKSILTNAKPHENADVILNIDLTKFFDTITEYRIFGIFRKLGYHPNLAVDLSKLCTCKIPKTYFDTFNDDEKEIFKDIFEKEIAVLPQGAPTSPLLSNLVLRKLDKRLNGIALKKGAKYSRYADDITFSGKFENLPKLSFIKRVISSENFHINWSKVRKFKKGQKQIVTGLLINERIRIPKKFKKEIYRHLHFCIKFGAKQHFDYLKTNHNLDKGFQKDWLLGKINYVNAIEPDEAKKMLELFNKIEWWI